MHEIPLNLVKPSPHPIRKTWDEQKMQELAQSIKEQGVIVPIKVRPPDDITPCRVHGWAGVDGEGSSYDRGTGYSCEGCIEAWTDPDPQNIAELIEDGFDPYFKVVYGHRRVEAARRAGLEAIPAIVEGVEDTDALIQALIENVQREDMHPLDVARALDAVLESGYTKADLERAGIMGHERAHYFLSLLDETPEVQSRIGVRKGGGKVRNAVTDLIMSGEPITETHVRQPREAGIADKGEREKVLIKASDEGLTYRETRSVADAYVAAKTPELKQAILETSGKLGNAERITQVAEMKVAGRHVADGQEVRREKAFQEFDSAVKDFLDAMKMFEHMIDAATKAAKYGKFSPESKPFTIRKIDRLINALETLKEELSNGL